MPGNSKPVPHKLRKIYRMQNPIQNYAWGSRSAIARLLGRNQDADTPEAEIWMGAHPKAPSSIWYGDTWHRLDEIISEYPEVFLGADVSKGYNGALPYLFKVLAVAEPLSIQAHPNAAQARTGFENENRRNIPLSADNRNYKDDRHKPECICALTPFWGVCGFRAIDQIRSMLNGLWPHTANIGLEVLKEQGLQAFFSQLMQLPGSQRVQLISTIVERVRQSGLRDEVYRWLLRLNEYYPGDVGVLSPILLNLVHLKPGEAIFLAAGQLHAYLDGVGIELMASSDNVLRGGLTPKHIDVPELLKVLDFTPNRPEVLESIPVGVAEKAYPSPVEDFRLSVIDIKPGRSYVAEPSAMDPQILLCTHSASGIECSSDTQTLTLQSGQSLFVAAGVGGYELLGSGTVYKARINV